MVVLIWGFGGKVIVSVNLIISKYAVYRRKLGMFCFYNENTRGEMFYTESLLLLNRLTKSVPNKTKERIFFF